MKTIFAAQICRLFTRAVSLALLLMVFACGQNYLKSRAPSSPYEEAQTSMEKGDFLAARALLEPYVAENPENEKAIALLASTYAAEVGISIFDLSTKGLDSNAASGQGLASLVPEPTDGNLLIVKTAKDLVFGIPEVKRVGDISLGATVYVTVYGMLLITYLAQTEQTPTIEQLLEIVSSLDQASELASASGIPSDQIDSIRSTIQSQDGETTEQKVDAYLEEVRAQGGILPGASVEVNGASSPGN